MTRNSIKKFRCERNLVETFSKELFILFNMLQKVVFMSLDESVTFQFKAFGQYTLVFPFIFSSSKCYFGNCSHFVPYYTKF